MAGRAIFYTLVARLARTAPDQTPGAGGMLIQRPKIERNDEALYAMAHRIRETEQALLGLFREGRISGTVHTCIGQEICQIGFVRALDNPRDVVLSNHRSHGHLLAYADCVEGLIAELMGRRGGLCSGRGGSQHLALGRFHSSGVQGGLSGVGIGMALEESARADGGIVAIFVGDGTLGEGLLYESMNLAGIWQVPVLFVVEDNKIAQTTPSDMTVAGDIISRGAAFGLHTAQLSDRSETYVADAARIVQQLRESGKPHFVVVETHRLGPHSKGDDHRPQSLLDEIRVMDPLTRLASRIPRRIRSRIEQQNRQRVTTATERAEAGELALYEGRPVTFEDPERPSCPIDTHSAEPVRVVASLNRTLHDLMQNHQEVILLGQDLLDPYGGAFKVSQGLSTRFPERVLATPISEAASMGVAIGLALAGKKPIVEVMFADFLPLALDQIYNHAVKFPWVYPNTEVSMVIRSASGGRRGYGPTHSQSPEPLLTSIPGLTVVCGSHRHRCGELLERAVLDWPYPVLFVESKTLYGCLQEPLDYAEVTPHVEDAASRLFPTLIRERGEPDVVLVAWGGAVIEAEKAAAELEQEEELAVSILLPSLLAPCPRHALCGALLSKPRIVIVEESPLPFGVGAELLALLAEAGHRGRVARVGAAPVPIPAAPHLEQQVLPDAGGIVDCVRGMFRGMDPESRR